MSEESGLTVTLTLSESERAFLERLADAWGQSLSQVATYMVADRVRVMAPGRPDGLLNSNTHD